jgi:hypothetical protein
LGEGKKEEDFELIECVKLDSRHFPPGGPNPAKKPPEELARQNRIAVKIPTQD